MQRENKNQWLGINKITDYTTSAIYFGWCLFLFQGMKGGGCRINAPGKARFYLAAGVFPIRYGKADVDGLVSSAEIKSRGWRKSVHIFISVIFCKSKAKHMRIHCACIDVFSYAWRTTKMSK